MFWRKTANWTLDCAAVMAGLLIAFPFVLVVGAPFITGS